MEDRVSPVNPRLDLLRREVEQKLLIPFRSQRPGPLRSWVRSITTIASKSSPRGARWRPGSPYSTAAAGSRMQATGICRTGSIESFSTVNPICSIPSRTVSPSRWEPLGDFFPFLVDLNRQVDPDRSPPVISRRPPTVRRLTAENPLDAVIARLQQFTSKTLARKLVQKAG